ncbi:hypothetical protein RvY_19160-2 [Ramazzottius varieornatus]|uniref:Uncharacterized protein n=1 Tax=Ramazzottius varieornatus TaxID=947166 RepID=A0A1D1W8H4_RAMVA|nr:hypothetical protein RvY_19160-2 [Ramazzottius varieornatus]
MGAVTNSTADVGIAAVGISASRNQHFTMIDSFLRRPYLVVIHRTHLISIPSSEFLQHTLGEMVSDSVWFSMISALLVLIILGMFVDGMEKTKEGKGGERSAESGPFRSSEWDWVFRVSVRVLSQRVSGFYHVFIFL